MRKRILKKAMLLIFMLIIIIFSNYSIVFGAISPDAALRYNGKDNPEGAGFVKDIVGMILSAVRIVAAGVAAITITVLGIQYMSAAPTERAEIKSKLINFTIGVGTVVTATETIKMLKDFAQQHVN